MSTREDLMTKIRAAMDDTGEEYMSKLDGLFLPLRLKREELVKAVEEAKDTYDAVWDLKDASASAWDAYIVAKIAVDDYDEKNT